jgi:hypothetical protein
VAGDHARDCNANVAGELVQTNDQSALVCVGQIELGRLGHRPAQALVDAEQYRGEHYPRPARREVDDCGDGHCHQPSQDQHPLAPHLLGQAPGDEVHRALDEAERHDEGGQKHERTARHAELSFCQGWHDVAHHPDGHADKQHLQQLLKELAKVGAYAELHVR